MIHNHTCISAACDVCGEPLRDPDSEAVIHLDTETEARALARSYRWPVTTTALICPARDADHEAAIAGLMPSEPMPANQPMLEEAQR